MARDNSSSGVESENIWGLSLPLPPSPEQQGQEQPWWVGDGGKGEEICADEHAGEAMEGILTFFRDLNFPDPAPTVASERGLQSHYCIPLYLPLNAASTYNQCQTFLQTACPCNLTYLSFDRLGD